MLNKLIGHSASQIRRTSRRPYRFETLEDRQMLTYLAQIGGTGFDEASFREHAVDEAGNTFITGRFEGTTDFDPGPGTTELTSETKTGFVAKYDMTGALVWVRSFDVDGKLKGRNPASSRGVGVALDGVGGVYATGSFGGQVDLTGDGSFVGSDGKSDIYIVKLDSSTGNTTWSRTIGGGDTDRGFEIAAQDGFLYATGDFTGIVDFDNSAGVDTLSSDEGSHFILKLDTAGGYIDSWNFGGSTGFPKHIVPDGENLIVAGIFTETADFDPSVNTDYRTSAGSTDWYVASYTTTGHLNWAQSIGNEDLSSEFVDVAIDDSSIYMTASFRQGSIDISNESPALRAVQAKSVSFSGSWPRPLMLRTVSLAIRLKGQSRMNSPSVFMVTRLGGSRKLPCREMNCPLGKIKRSRFESYARSRMLKSRRLLLTTRRS